MTYFVLKIIAIFSMLIDHSGYIIFNGFSFFNYIGRLAFPIFAFCITEGYIHTKNKKKYLLRLFLCAVFSQIPYMLFRSIISNEIFFNTIFTLTLGLITIIFYNYTNNKILKVLILLVFPFISLLCNFDYDYYGILLIFIFYIFKNNKKLMNLFFIILVIFYHFLNGLKNIGAFNIYLLLAISTCLSLIPINLYNGKKGYNLKYIFYIFYPLHLIILYLIYII